MLAKSTIDEHLKPLIITFPLKCLMVLGIVVFMIIQQYSGLSTQNTIVSYCTTYFSFKRSFYLKQIYSAQFSMAIIALVCSIGNLVKFLIFYVPYRKKQISSQEKCQEITANGLVIQILLSFISAWGVIVTLSTNMSFLIEGINCQSSLLIDFLVLAVLSFLFQIIFIINTLFLLKMYQKIKQTIEQQEKLHKIMGQESGRQFLLQDHTGQFAMHLGEMKYGSFNQKNKKNQIELQNLMATQIKSQKYQNYSNVFDEYDENANNDLNDGVFKSKLPEEEDLFEEDNINGKKILKLKKTGINQYKRTDSFSEDKVAKYDEQIKEKNELSLNVVQLSFGKDSTGKVNELSTSIYKPKKDQTIKVENSYNIPKIQKQQKREKQKNIQEKTQIVQKSQNIQKTQKFQNSYIDQIKATAKPKQEINKNEHNTKSQMDRMLKSTPHTQIRQKPLDKQEDEIKIRLNQVNKNNISFGSQYQETSEANNKEFEPQRKISASEEVFLNIAPNSQMKKKIVAQKNPQNIDQQDLNKFKKKNKNKDVNEQEFSLQKQEERDANTMYSRNKTVAKPKRLAPLTNNSKAQLVLNINRKPVSIRKQSVLFFDPASAASSQSSSSQQQVQPTKSQVKSNILQEEPVQKSQQSQPQRKVDTTKKQKSKLVLHVAKKKVEVQLKLKLFDDQPNYLAYFQGIDELGSNQRSSNYSDQYNDGIEKEHDKYQNFEKPVKNDDKVLASKVKTNTSYQDIMLKLIRSKYFDSQYNKL